MNARSTGGKSAADVVQIGIVGLGAAGRAFLPAILAHPGFRLIAIAEPVASVRADAMGGHGATAYNTMQALLEHPGLDAVYIATPTHLHPDREPQPGEHVRRVRFRSPLRW